MRYTLTGKEDIKVPVIEFAVATVPGAGGIVEEDTIKAAGGT
jgi:hypothetical protein